MRLVHVSRRRLAGAVLLCLMLTLATLVASARGTTAPQSYYLALGDSIAYGYQQSKVDAGRPAPAFRTGFVDVFAARLARVRPGIRTVNYSCPGESSASMTVRCRWSAGGGPLHDGYHGAQLTAALAFLRAHPGQVSPITVSLISNDVNALARACPGVDVACVLSNAPAAIAAYRKRMAAILGRLRAAAPHAVIILTGAYDPLVDGLALADPLVAQANEAERAAGAAVGARFADPMTVFNPDGSAAAERRALCAMTAVCASGDPHPTDAGYRRIAGLVWAASGYRDS